jgi:hypothetical protein
MAQGFDLKSKWCEVFHQNLAEVYHQKQISRAGRSQEVGGMILSESTLFSSYLFGANSSSMIGPARLILYSISNGRANRL